jgi:hypothetical protein
VLSKGLLQATTQVFVARLTVVRTPLTFLFATTSKSGNFWWGCGFDDRKKRNYTDIETVFDLHRRKVGSFGMLLDKMRAPVFLRRL